ncbi:uncharacterized protein (TIGR03083 family) [Streptacidiphilus sp. MAP12-20]|uniref:maleylpyruvate isomerase family mycothiol-dependent enzyme n=1 Tax=Streptacidiphilus sp. MAP12-20 TaxID=3156299 RepID=UPI003514CD4E
MTATEEYAQLITLVAERSAAFRAALGTEADLGAPVPSCPDWSLRDLVAHLGMVHRFWAATVTAGPADGPQPEENFVFELPQEREQVLAWSAESTDLLLSALRATDPERGCWTWWGRADAPQTAGAVARHQVHEALVHTYDAQLSIGRVEPLPGVIALDTVDEFLHVACGASGAWPHEPVLVALHAEEGPAWLLSLSAEGARTRPLAPGSDEAASTATVSARGTASDLALALYGRVPLDTLKIEGERSVLAQLRVWQPSE